jgi:hypothetical protein
MTVDVWKSVGRNICGSDAWMITTLARLTVATKPPIGAGSRKSTVIRTFRTVRRFSLPAPPLNRGRNSAAGLDSPRTRIGAVRFEEMTARP